MRYARVLVAVGFLVFLGLGVIAAPVSAQDGTPMAMAEHPLVGAWVLDNNADDPANPPELIVFTADGSYIGAAADGSDTIGSWEPTGPNSAAITLLFFAPGAEGGFGGTVTVRGTVEVAEDGQTFTAPFTLESTAPDGARSGEFGPSTAMGMRIAVASMGTPVGPLSALFGPMEATPAP